jgi:hypothetical protein
MAETGLEADDGVDGMHAREGVDRFLGSISPTFYTQFNLHVSFMRSFFVLMF